MSHYKPYPAYRDSGVEWIGRVPEHWVALPFKRLAMICNGQDYKDVADPSGEIPVMGSGGEFARASRPLFDGESVLIGRKGTIDKPLYMNGPFWTVDTMFYTLIDDQADGRFVYYAATNIPFDRYSTNTALPSMTQEDISSHMLAAPKKNEQTAIAAALDRETARIDALIAKKTRFIELLKEKRQALITHAVTKGLDPTVKMKDSGVEWIGEVPEHWEISKLAYTTREAGGKTPDTTNQAYWDGDVPWVSPKDMKQAEIVDAIDKISDTAVSDCGMTLFAPGTILAVVRGMILAHSFPVAELKVPATINQDMKALKPDRRIRPNYLRLILETAKDYVVSVLVAEAAHGTRVLRTDVWRQLPALLPPAKEQDLILAELDRGTATYNKLIQKVEHSIALLKERRSALITAAVTGQIDLRECTV